MNMLTQFKYFCLQILFYCFIWAMNTTNIHAQCFGGQLFTGNAESSISICPEDVMENGLNFFSTSFAPTNYAYVVTDINNRILTISLSSTLDFEGLIEGNYFVYGFSFLGEITANQGDFIFTTMFASGCWQISSTRVEVQLASPGTNEVRTGDFQTMVNLCINEGAPDIVQLQSISSRNTPFVFVVTDNNGSILMVTEESVVDFTNAAFGDCYVYGLAYTGDLLANFGMNVNEDILSTGCFELSENFVTVNRSQVNGGNVFTDEFISFYNFTTDDGLSNSLNFSNSGSVGAEYVLILTDQSNNIVEFLDQPNFDFEGLEAGVFRVWGYSFSGDILLTEGQSIFTTPFSSGCFNLSANAIVITTVTTGVTPPACTLESPQISALSGTTFCANQPGQILVTDANLNTGATSALLILDQNETILQIATDSEVSTQALPAGVFSVLQIVHEQIDNLTIGQSLNDLVGCFALSNSIQITKFRQDDAQCTVPPVCSLQMGSLMADTNEVCIEDPNANTIIFTITNNSNEGLEGILITDLDGTILELSANTVFNITTLGPSQYFYINYIDTVQIFGGTSIQDLEGCFTLSDPITITGIDNCFIAPCEIEAAQLSTQNSTTLCAMDETDDTVTFTSVGGTGDVNLFLLADEGQNILQANTSGTFQFADDQLGVFQVYKLDYNEPFELPENISNLEGCFALSTPVVVENAIDNCTVEPPSTCQNDGGQIVYNGPEGICGSDNQNDILDIDVISQGASNRLFLVVDEAGLIINIAPALVILSNPFAPGRYDIYLLSFEDFPSEVMLNANINSIEGLCLSNSVSILVSDDFCEGEGVRGGRVSASGEFEDDRVQLCTNVSGEIFTINLSNSGSEAFDYVFVETDQNNVITEILSGESVMYIADPTEIMNRRIWGVSFSGNFTAFIGEVITDVSLSDDSFSLSENFVEVTISVVIAEDPVIAGVDIPFLEIPSGQIFSIDFEAPMSSFLDFETAYILFDTNGVTIIDVLFPDANFVITLPELEATPASGALLQLTAVAYTGDFLLGPGDEADSAFLPFATNVTTGCFEVANTSISISVFDAGGGGLIVPLGEEIGASSSENEENFLRPNPARDFLLVTFPNSFVDQTVVLNIFDTSGKLILKRKFDAAPESEKIEVSRFIHGTYILQAYTNSSARTAQFLKI